MKKIILFLLMFVVLSVSVLAADSFTAEKITKSASIHPDESAFVKLKVTSLINGSEFQVKFSDRGWTGRTSPLSDYKFVLSEGETKEISVYLTPISNQLPAPYTVPVIIENLNTGEEVSVDMSISVLGDVIREYVPIIKYDITADYEVDPRNEFTVKLNLANLNLRDLSSLKIKVYSELFEAKREIGLGPKKTVEEVFTFVIDDNQEPISDVIYAEIETESVKGIHKWEKTKAYKIISYEDISEDVVVQKDFLRRTTSYIFTNNGNVASEVSKTQKTSFLRAMFESTYPNADNLKNSEGRFYVWFDDVESDETIELTVVSNYRYFTAFIIIVLLIIALYYLYRPPILVKKEVSHIGTNEGGISEIKVILYIKNRTKQVINDIKIIEKIPHIVDVSNEFVIGTIKPTSVVQNAKKGTLAKWELENVEGFEERIITYNIKSKLSIVGGLTLPHAIVKYVQAGRMRVTKSNRLVLEV